jgi:hypothetical protein
MPSVCEPMNFESETQTLTHPRQGDYIYLGEVERSDAYYIRRVYQLSRIDPTGGFIVIDHLGYEQLLKRSPIKKMGFAHAWKAIEQDEMI